MSTTGRCLTDQRGAVRAGAAALAGPVGDGERDPALVSKFHARTAAWRSLPPQPGQLGPLGATPREASLRNWPRGAVAVAISACRQKRTIQGSRTSRDTGLEPAWEPSADQAKCQLPCSAGWLPCSNGRFHEVVASACPKICPQKLFAVTKPVTSSANAASTSSSFFTRLMVPGGQAAPRLTTA